MTTDILSYKELSISERIQLVEDIWDSIAEEKLSNLQLSAEESNEIQRRLAAHQADHFKWHTVGTNPSSIAQRTTFNSLVSILHPN